MRTKILTLFILASAGLIFAGYLSGVKLLTNTCAFNEACPYFLGYPACWYGFAMYLVMWLAALAGLAGWARLKNVFAISTFVSLLGIVFAGSFFLEELLRSKVTGKLGLSTCAYGLIFYIAIFAISFIARRESSREESSSSTHG